MDCFWTWQNGVFWVCFLRFTIKKVCFLCVWHCFKSVKNACFCFFPVVWAFLGWLIVVHLGLEGLGVFVFLVFVFLFCVVFVYVLFALLLVVCGWMFLFCSFVCVCVCFFSFFVFPFLFSFLLIFCFFCFSFLFIFEGLRVKWGGPKCHFTWH